ncbi:MAG: UDP-N-acetylmuramoyl-tripeptide--D-alanyl-D-alanine ligase [Robiginitomaculum sp.]|nr:UDP-N-acetylmuramoyl-tripeptide--D-alanyl-D-alanine ligase [Robiginitomaculum sp.]
MRALWTHREAELATGGQAVGEWDVNGLSIDTRSLETGQLFVPLKDIRDGHDFIPMAYEKGAGAVISEHPVSDTPALIVPDGLKALEDLAIAARKRSSAVRIAVTGSVGKTSVKELIATMCRAAGNTHASIKSYNNHWGVPLTLAGMAQDTKYGVFEMGMNHAGELAALSKIVRPNIALITKIAPAHMAHFENIEGIAKAKAEIFASLEKGGTAIIPADSPHASLLAQQAGNVNVLRFGFDEHADARILSSSNTPSGSRARMDILGETVDVEIPLVGAHWIENVAVALLVVKVAGVDLELASNALKTQGNISGRGQVFNLCVDQKQIRLIDESYNANPESMRAAIAVLGLNRGRKIAVLGDMLELGDDEAAMHVDLFGPLQDAKIDLVVTCGECMKNLNDVLPKAVNGGWYKDHNACLDGLISSVKDGDIVMVKGSNASGMGKLVASLKQYSHANNNSNKKDKTHVL